MHIGNQVWGNLGVFDQFECQWVVVYVAAALDEPNSIPVSFDLYACSSDNQETCEPGDCPTLANAPLEPPRKSVEPPQTTRGS